MADVAREEEEYRQRKSGRDPPKSQRRKSFSEIIAERTET